MSINMCTKLLLYIVFSILNRVQELHLPCLKARASREVAKLPGADHRRSSQRSVLCRDPGTVHPPGGSPPSTSPTEEPETTLESGSSLSQQWGASLAHTHQRPNRRPALLTPLQVLKLQLLPTAAWELYLLGDSSLRTPWQLETPSSPATRL